MGQKEKISGFVILMQRTAYLFVILMIGVFPLIYRNGYIDILRTKLAFFHICIWVFVVAIVFLGVLELLHSNNSMTDFWEKIQKIILSKWDVEIIFAIIFIFAILMSVISSPYPAEAWRGMKGRKMGGEMMMQCVVMYLLVAKLLRPDKRLAYIFLISNTMVFGLGILNFWGIDILHMYGTLASRQQSAFIGTTGNINANASYICLILPIAMVFYTQSEKLLSKFACGGFLILGFYEAYTTISDSWILGIGVSYLVLLWHSLCGNRKMEIFWELCGLFFISSLILKFTLLVGEWQGADSPMFVEFHKLKLQNLMLNGYVLLGSGIMLAGCGLFLYVVERKEHMIPYRGIKKVVFSIVIAVAVVGAVLTGAANLSGRWRKRVKWLKMFKIKDSFGTNRGYIWRRTVRAWVGLPFGQKVFGYGSNCFQQFIDVDYGREIRQLYGKKFVDAHNEFLQLLVTMGVLGVVGYFGMIISTAWSSARASKDTPVMLLGTIALSSFLAQGLVNNPTGFITPNLFLLMGIVRSMGKNNVCHCTRWL